MKRTELNKDLVEVPALATPACRAGMGGEPPAVIIPGIVAIIISLLADAD